MSGWFVIILALSLVLFTVWVAAPFGLDRKPSIMRRLVWLAVLTSLFVIAWAFTGFLRAMAHPSIGMNPAKFIARENTNYWRMVGVEAAAYVVACIFVIWRLRRT